MFVRLYQHIPDVLITLVKILHAIVTYAKLPNMLRGTIITSIKVHKSLHLYLGYLDILKLRRLMNTPVRKEGISIDAEHKALHNKTNNQHRERVVAQIVSYLADLPVGDHKIVYPVFIEDAVKQVSNVTIISANQHEVVIRVS